MQAIDPRTRMVLFKMLNRGVFNDINGCISTGKEVEKGHYWFHIICTSSVLLFELFVSDSWQANVYHATKSDGQELAIKVYKTSVLVFK